MNTPAYWMNAIPVMTPMTMQEKTGVCSLGFTFASHFDPGSVSSRDIPKQRRIVAVSIARQHTKIAAETTIRNAADMAEPKFDSMMFAGPNPPLIAAGRLWMPSSMQKRKTAPITNAPMTDAITAFGASVRGLLVSSANVDAVSRSEEHTSELQSH